MPSLKVPCWTSAAPAAAGRAAAANRQAKRKVAKRCMTARTRLSCECCVWVLGAAGARDGPAVAVVALAQARALCHCEQHHRRDYRGDEADHVELPDVAGV